jgi:serine/threonine protein kinase
MMVCQVLLSEKSLYWRVLNTLILSSKLSLFTIYWALFRLKEVIYSEDKLYLIFEYCDYDLKKYMRQVGGPLPPQEVKSFTY